MIHSKRELKQGRNYYKKKDIWYKYLSKHDKVYNINNNSINLSTVPPNCNWSVMEKDIERSMWYIVSNSSHTTYASLNTMEYFNLMYERKRLKIVLISALMHTGLHYYQGLHEIIAVFILYYSDSKHTIRYNKHRRQYNSRYKTRNAINIIRNNLNSALCLSIAVISSHLFPFCHKDIKPTMNMMKSIHTVLCKYYCPTHKLVMELVNTNLAPDTHYTISWMITWFTHYISCSSTIYQLFSYLLRRTKNSIIFICSAFIILQEDYILNLFNEVSGMDKEIQFGILYSKLSALPGREIQMNGITFNYFSYNITNILSLANRIENKFGDHIDKVLNSQDKNLKSFKTFYYKLAKPFNFIPHFTLWVPRNGWLVLVYLFINIQRTLLASLAYLFNISYLNFVNKLLQIKNNMFNS